jgi:pilus assembly protein Flp/PilA
MTFLKRFVSNQSGATAIEYGLIAALISIGIITGAASMGSQTGGMFNTINSKM